MTKLDGIRVLSLEQYISGPYCTSILADAGAEVIKVEQPGSGDPRRDYLPMIDAEHPEINAGYVPYNRGKKSIELDIKSADGVEKLKALLEEADVFVSNLRPGVLSQVGLSPAELRLSFPRLIICEISGYGVAEGERSAWPAFDSVIQASSGLSSLLGAEPDGPPLLAPMSMMDMLSGAYAALGILVGLVGRARTGAGAHIDAAMQDVAATLLMRPLTLHEFTGVIPTRGLDHYSPVGLFPAGDGRWVSIVIPTTIMWERTCRAIDRLDLLDHPDLVTNESRAAAMQSLILPELTNWASEMTADEAADVLRTAGQPAGVVASIAEVRADPQLAARGLFVPIDGYEDRLRVPRLPLLFDGVADVPGSIARLGEHTEEVVG